MKRTLALASSLAVVALAGCSSQIDRKTASGSYEYLKTEETKNFPYLLISIRLLFPESSRCLKSVKMQTPHSWVKT